MCMERSFCKSCGRSHFKCNEHSKHSRVFGPGAEVIVPESFRFGKFAVVPFTLTLNTVSSLSPSSTSYDALANP